MQLNISLYRQCRRMDSSHAKLQKNATQHQAHDLCDDDIGLYWLAAPSLKYRSLFKNESSTLMYDITVVTI